MKKLTGSEIRKIFLENIVVWGLLLGLVICLLERDWSLFFFMWFTFGAGMFVADLLKAAVKKPEKRILALLLKICWTLIVAGIYFFTSLLVYGFSREIVSYAVGVFIGFMFVDCVNALSNGLSYIIKHHIIYRPETETVETATDTGTLKVSVTRWRKRGKHEEKCKM